MEEKDIRKIVKFRWNMLEETLMLSLYEEKIINLIRMPKEKYDRYLNAEIIFGDKEFNIREVIKLLWSIHMFTGKRLDSALIYGDWFKSDSIKEKIRKGKIKPQEINDE